MKYKKSLIRRILLTLIILTALIVPVIQVSPVIATSTDEVFNGVGVADGVVISGNYIYMLSQERDSNSKIQVVKVNKNDFTDNLIYYDATVKGGRAVAVAGGYLWTVEGYSAAGMGTKLSKRSLTTLEVISSCEPLISNADGFTGIDAICVDDTYIYCFGYAITDPYYTAKVNMSTMEVTTYSHTGSLTTNLIHAAITDTVNGFIYISILPNGVHPGVYAKLNVSDMAIVAQVNDSAGGTVYSHDDALQDANYVYFNGDDGHLKRFAKSDMTQTDLHLTDRGLTDGMCFLNGSGNQGQTDGSSASGYLLTEEGAQLEGRYAYAVNLNTFTLDGTYSMPDSAVVSANELMSDGTYIYQTTFGGYPDRWVELKRYEMAFQPEVNTSTITSIGLTTATGGANVESDGGATIIERGVCIGESADPTILDTKFDTTGTTGVFTVAMTGLSPSTTYHLRGYATNSEGTGYSDDITFTTTDIPPTPPKSSGVNLLLIMLPLEVAAILIVLAVLRIKSDGSIKALILTAAMIIFLIITFLVINQFLVVVGA